MPRPFKSRRICAMPDCDKFGPMNSDKCIHQNVIMTVDEYESLRLIDLESLTQEQCAKRMNVARTTAQSIYNSARRKLTDCLVNNKMLIIEGGDYFLCDGSNKSCGCRHSCGHRCHIINETGEDNYE